MPITYKTLLEFFGHLIRYEDLAEDLADDLKSNQAFIPLDITALREIATNDTQNLAAHGGILAKDSAPILERVDLAVDKALRVKWVATDVTEVQFPPIPIPPDLDSAEDVILHLLVQRSGNTDACQIELDAYEGVGDAKVEDDTDALATTNVTEVTATVGSGHVSGHPNFLNFTLTPKAHGTDTLSLYAAWVEYTRKLRD